MWSSQFKARLFVFLKIVEAILEVLSVNWDRKKLNERVLEFSWEKVVNSEIDVYNEILN